MIGASLSFCLPGPPRGKGRARAVSFRPKGSPVSRARMFSDHKTVTFEAELSMAFRTKYPDWVAPDPGPVELVVEAGFAIPASASLKKKADMMGERILPLMKPDLKNILASVEDALNGLAWHDDSEIVHEDVRKYYSTSPGVRVWIKFMEVSA